MKNTLVIAAALLMAAPAMASKARTAALSGVATLVDTQTIFASPEHLTALGDWATFEFGTAGTATANGAEGGFARSHGDSKYGFYLGHGESIVTAGYPPLLAGSGNIEQNPFNVFYASKAGDLAWGLNLHYANSDVKTAPLKKNVTTLTAGFGSGAWDAGISFRATDMEDDGTTKVEGSGMRLDGGYWFDESLYGYAAYDSAAIKDAADSSTITLGVVKEEKVEGGKFFYGAAYEMATLKNKATGGGKYESSSLPFIVGVEADAATWLVLRGSVTQNVLLGSEKDDFAGAGGAESDTLANNTTVAAGAGLKFGKLTVDGTLAGSTTGDIDGNSLLSTASMTYNF